MRRIEVRCIGSPLLYFGSRESRPLAGPGWFATNLAGDTDGVKAFARNGEDRGRTRLHTLTDSHCRPPIRSARIISCAGLDGRPPRHLARTTPCRESPRASSPSSWDWPHRSTAARPAPTTPRPSDPPPKGEVTKYTFDKSKIFPGTVRDYWIYVPKQYDPAKPACLYVNQDGIQYNAPAVFDELIHKKEMPVIIGVFVTPGRVKAPHGQALDRFNRSYEYDGLGDNYARFLLEELLPEVETKTTADGRPIRLRSDGNDRCIAGASSGAICAFTAAWERPDAFRRVFSAIGTYVGLRGGNVYPTLIRKYEPKPIRVFLQDGSADLNIYGGDWWMANQEMERALDLRRLRGQPRLGQRRPQRRARHRDLPRRHAMALEGLARARQGRRRLAAAPGDPHPRRGLDARRRGLQVHRRTGRQRQGRGLLQRHPQQQDVQDRPRRQGQPVRSPTRSRPTARRSGPTAGSTRSPAARAGPRLRRRRQARPSIAEGFRGNDLVVRHDGGIYVTNPGRDGTEPSKVWYISPKGEKRVVDTGLKFANGITLSPDQSLLYVADSRSHWVYSYQIQPDGSLAYKQKYYHLHVARHRRRQPAPTACASTATAGSTSRRGWASRSATRPAASTASSPRPTAGSPTSASAARTSTRSTPPAATASTSARSRSRARTPTRPRSSPRHHGYDSRTKEEAIMIAAIVESTPLRQFGLVLARSPRSCSPSPWPRSTPGARTSPPREGWIALFNGKDLDGWTPKIKGYPAGENYADTFRVEDGVLKVAYDKYPKFDGKFGHLFYKTPFSHYRLRIEYRFVGDQCPGGPGWAFRNSGVMIHGQTAREHEEGPGIPGLDRGPVPRGQRPRQATDGERLHARHEHRDGRQADHRALHRLEVEDLSRRPVGHRRSRGPRQRRHQAHRQRRDRARIREAPARRQATPTAAG